MAVVGWILLSILLLLLGIIFLILFFPITYDVSAKKDAEGLTVKSRVRWLLGFVRMLYDYPDPKQAIIKVAFFTISGPKKKKKGKKTGKGSELEGNSETNAGEAGNAVVENASEGNPGEVNTAGSITEDAESPEPATAEIIAEEDVEGDSASEDSTSETPDQYVSQNEESSSSKKEEKDQKKKKKFSLSSIKEKIEFYKELWEDDVTRPFLKDAWKRILHVLKNVLPRKVTGEIVFGAETPDVTGYVYGLHCALRAKYPRKFIFTFTPDFENKILEGNLRAKGGFPLIVLIIDGIRLVLDKRLKQIRAKFKARDEQEENKEQ